MSRKILRGLFVMPAPNVAVEIGSECVAAVQMSGSNADTTLLGYACESLDKGIVTPKVNDQNVRDKSVVADCLRNVLRRLPRMPSRVALVLPDSAAKVSIVRFESVPSRADDVDALIRWKVRKTAPFRVEDAQVSYARGSRGLNGEQDFVVALVRRDVVEQYEEVCADVGVHAGRVDLASFNLINAALSTMVDEEQRSERPDWLLVNVNRTYSTLVIMRGQDPIFFRSRMVENGMSLSDLVHQTAMYYEDRLGGTGLAGAFLTGGATTLATEAEQEHQRHTLEDRLQTPVELLTARLMQQLNNQIKGDSEFLDCFTAPIGILLRDRCAQGMLG